MPRSKTAVEAALISKGFRRFDNDHTFFVYFTKDGRKSRARTKTSHGGKMKDIPDNLLGQMAKQCRLTKSEFLGLVDCPLDRDGYEAILQSLNEI